MDNTIERTKQDSLNNEDLINEEDDTTLEELLEEGEVTKEEHDEYEKMINERAKKISDESIDAIINNIVDQVEISPDEKAKAKLVLKTEMKKKQAMSDDLEEYTNEIEKAFAKNQKDLDELFQSMNYSETLVKIKELIDVANKHKQTNALLYYKKLYNEIDSILRLTNFKIKLIRRNKRKKTSPLNNYDINYDIEYTKFFNNLGNNKKYRFVDPSKLLLCLEEYFPVEKKHYAKKFLYLLYKSINVAGDKGVSENSVFLEGIFKNIYSLKSSDDKFNLEDKEIFVNSIYEYVDIADK